MQSLDAFMSRLIPQVQGCPLPLAEQALVDSAIDFCDETCAVTVITEPQMMIPGVAQYELDLPPHTDVSRVLQIWVGSTPIRMISGPDANSLVSALAGAASGGDIELHGAPSGAAIRSGELTLIPTPDAQQTGRLTARVAIRPKPTATQFHDDLYLRWRSAVIDGALYRLAQMSGQPFSDLATSVRARAEYERAVGRARIEFNRAGMAPNITPYGRPFV